MKNILVILALICGLTVSAFAQTDPVSIRDQVKRAEELVNTGRRSEALKELQAIANSEVFDPAGFYNLGNSFARLGETEAALTAYRRAVEQRRGNYSRALNNMGVVLLRAGRWDEAYDALIGALQIEKFRYAEASYNLGRVYAARGQSDLAAREWRRAVAVDPGHAAALQALNGARNDERIVVVADAKPRPPVVKAAAVEAPREPKSVSVSSPKTLTLDQTSFDFLQRARSASENGKLTEAVENFRRVLSRQNGYFAPANLELSYALLSLKRYDEALGNLIQVSARDGARYPISYFHLARTYEAKGDLKNAETAFSQAIAYTPANAQFLLDLARVREKQGDFKGALDALERYVTVMQNQGQKPAWSDQRIAELRSKIK
ncbi:MAG TPA: tetratricopeptide repeat protein [Pyrinomonadaceae bacterium]|nr:tetratricopeptide repeat protein [Pyrinomonadaceae bacterium]